MNIDNIFINIHSSIKMIFDKVIYFDPYKIEERFNDADIIFFTHEHYDHFDFESINKSAVLSSFISLSASRASILMNTVNELRSRLSCKIIIMRRLNVFLRFFYF